jgi:predicted transcriptional regulator
MDEDVAIKDLDGLVSLIPGTIHVLKLPSIREGGSSSVSIEWIRGQYNTLSPDKLGVMDVVSQAVAKKAKLDIDFEFAALSASVEAAEKGLSVMLMASDDQIHTIVSTIESTNKQIEDKIDYDILSSEE